MILFIHKNVAGPSCNGLSLVCLGKPCWPASFHSFSWTIQWDNTCRSPFEFWQQMGQRFLSPDSVCLVTALLYPLADTDMLYSLNKISCQTLWLDSYLWTLNKQAKTFNVNNRYSAIYFETETKTSPYIKLADLHFIKCTESIIRLSCSTHRLIKSTDLSSSQEA